ncbi:MAG: transposase [Leptolyngbya sp. SIO1D8]|nr:transposase [Leptolyngbya sp. SIO1D8]
MQKALNYGQMLLDVYCQGVLLKSASGDIAAHMMRLQQWKHPKAREMAIALGKLIE